MNPGLTLLGPSTACPCTEHCVADFGKYMMSMTRCYWLFTEQFTARGNDAENVQLPDLFLMKSKAAAQSPSAKETEALFFTTFDQKTNNEDRLEMGACLRQKSSIQKDLSFALFNYLRYRFVHLRLFDKEKFIPKVRTWPVSAPSNDA